MKETDLKLATEGRRRQAERDAWREGRRMLAEREHQASLPSGLEPLSPLGHSIVRVPRAESEFRQRLEAGQRETGTRDESTETGEPQHCPGEGLGASQTRGREVTAFELARELRIYTR